MAYPGHCLFLPFLLTYIISICVGFSLARVMTSSVSTIEGLSGFLGYDRPGPSDSPPHRLEVATSDQNDEHDQCDCHDGENT